jgi:hypothetical protein
MLPYGGGWPPNDVATWDVIGAYAPVAAYLVFFFGFVLNPIIRIINPKKY